MTADIKRRLSLVFTSIHPRDTLLGFCLLLGRIPFWVMLLALVARKPAQPAGIFCLFLAAVIARSFLHA